MFGFVSRQRHSPPNHNMHGMDESVLGEKCTVFCVLCTAGVSKEDWPRVYFAVQSVLCTLRATLSEQLR